MDRAYSLECIILSLSYSSFISSFCHFDTFLTVMILLDLDFFFICKIVLIYLQRI